MATADFGERSLYAVGELIWVRAMTTPVLVAIATPAMKEAETFSGLGSDEDDRRHDLWACHHRDGQGIICSFMISSQSAYAMLSGLLLPVLLTTGCFQSSRLRYLKNGRARGA
jgi:hypothetical protein